MGRNDAGHRERGVTDESPREAGRAAAAEVCEDLGAGAVLPIGSEEHALDQLRVGVVLVGPGGRIHAWDPGMVELTGIPAHEAVGNPIWDVRYRLVPEEDRRPGVRESFRAIYERVLENEGSQLSGVPLEDLVVRADGSRRTHESVLFLVKVGETPYIASVHRDVTAQREVARRVASLARFPAEDPHPILRLTADGCLTYANDASAPLLAAWGCAPGRLLPPAWVERVRRVLAEGQPDTTEVRAGDQMFALTLAPIAAHDEVNVYGMDITARLRAEEAAHRSEQSLRRAFEHAPSGVAIVDPSGRLLEANQALADLTGYSREDLTRMGWAALIYPDDVEEGHLRMAGALAGGAETFRIQQRIVRRDGEVRWATLDGVLLGATTGEPAHFLLQAQDETERRRADELALRVAIAARVEEAEEHERRRVSQELHDRVGQELSALGISLGILRMQCPHDAWPEMATRLDDALSLVEDITASVRNVMAELRPPMLDEYGLLAALRWYGGIWASRANLAVRVVGREPIPALPTHVAIMLFRIVQEALVNIVRHARATEVYIRLRQRPGELRLSVADNGRGFDSHAVGGMGVEGGWGLRTMAERATAVGARLSVKSRVGGGTRVVVCLPYGDARPGALDVVSPHG